MPNGEILHPFSPQDKDWDDLWISRDGDGHFAVDAKHLINQQVGEADTKAVKDVCAFFMNLKKDTCRFQTLVDWSNPSSRIKTVLDKIARDTPPIVDSAPIKKQNKQQRRSLVGTGRDLPDSLPGLAVEWDVEADYSLVWNDNQNGAAYNAPELLTRLLQQVHYLPEKSVFLAEGKIVDLL